MSYVEKHLSRGEQIVLKAKKNPLYLVMPFIFFVLLFVLAIVGQTFVSRISDPRSLYIEENLESAVTELEEGFQADETTTAEEKSNMVMAWNLMMDASGNSSLRVSNFEEISGVIEKYCRIELGERYDRNMGISSGSAGAQEADESIAAIGKSLTVVLWILFFLIGLLPFLVRLCRFFSFSLALTNKRVVGKAGILRIHSMDYPIDKIDHVEIKAGIFGNLFRYAQLSVMSVGSADMHYSKTRKMFVGIRNAQDFKDAVTEAVERHAAEARKAQAEEIARAMGGGYQQYPPQYPPQYPQPPRYPR